MSSTDTPKPCPQWPLGKCKFGSECYMEHHDNLNPSLVYSKNDPEYTISNEVGEACQRCMQRMYPCDKKGRGGGDDPCSECRWFGGDNCNCVLSAFTSYNDQIWGIMMSRGKSKNYTLPPNRLRDEKAKKAKFGPQPIPDSKIKADWQGETREALLSKPDMLPSGVRELPRAYLVPPREDRGLAKYLVWADNNKKRGLESESSTGAGRLPTFPPPPTFERPPADPVQGEVVTTTYNWDTNQYTYVYVSGAELTGPAAIPPTHDWSKHGEQFNRSPSPTKKKRKRHESSVQQSTAMEVDASAQELASLQLKPGVTESAPNIELPGQLEQDLYTHQEEDPDAEAPVADEVVAPAPDTYKEDDSDAYEASENEDE